jgi:hypothetical protein
MFPYTRVRERIEKMAHPPRETELNKAPALRISHIVYGRLNEHPEGRGRVSYLLDPDGLGEARDIPEEVVLHRWRRRVMDGHTFHGCRLGPNLWRAVNHAMGRNAEELISLGLDEIAKLRSTLSVGRDEHHFRLQDAGHVAVLFQGLGKDRLQAILDRQQLQYLKMFRPYRNQFISVWFDIRRQCRVETTMHEQVAVL